MNSIVFYFSGTGNTKWSVEQLDSLLIKRGHQSTVYSIDTDIPETVILKALQASDYIGFAYPLYGANIPRMMRTFLKRVMHVVNTNAIENKKLFFISTFGYVNGHGFFNANALFKSASFKTVGYINLHLTANTPKKTNIRALTGSALPSKKKQKAVRRLNRFIKRIEAGKKMINGIGPHLFVGILIRYILRDEIKKNHRLMHVDMEKCSQCMKCVKSCPVSSIAYTNKAFTFSSACEACMRCYNLCPTQAISNS